PLETPPPSPLPSVAGEGERDSRTSPPALPLKPDRPDLPDRINYAAMIQIDLQGKRGLVMGVANGRSLGWAIAERLHQAGAQLAFSYQGERLREDLEKL